MTGIGPTMQASTDLAAGDVQRLVGRRSEVSPGGRVGERPDGPEVMERSDVVALLARARGLCVPGHRHILGITGSPGAGKSTLSEQLVRALGSAAVLVPMDGFHLAEVELRRLGAHERKGAPDTFDVRGFIVLLGRLKDQQEDVVYAPEFRRDIEEPIAGAIPVDRSVPLVVTEGNYLLSDVGGWAEVRGFVDEVWYLQPGEAERVERLVKRHVAFGRDRASAVARALGTDQRNAELVQRTLKRADLVVTGAGVG